MNNKLDYCNWTFWEVLKPSDQWAIERDCDSTPLVEKDEHREHDFHESATFVLSRDTKAWNAYKSSLQPQVQQRYPYPKPGAQCPKCHKQVNGVNPYDNGETWRI